MLAVLCYVCGYGIVCPSICVCGSIFVYYMCNNGLLRAEMFPASFEGWRQIRHDQVNDIIL